MGLSCSWPIEDLIWLSGFSQYVVLLWWLRNFLFEYKFVGTYFMLTCHKLTTSDRDIVARQRIE